MYLLSPTDRIGGSGLSMLPYFLFGLFSVLLQIYFSLFVSQLHVDLRLTIPLIVDGRIFVVFLVDLVFGFQPTAQNPLADVRQFIQEFESDYGQKHPPFVESTYEQVTYGDNKATYMYITMLCKSGIIPAQYTSWDEFMLFVESVP